MPPAFQPIAVTDKLSEQVARRLTAEIRSGRLAPQDKLPTEAALVEQFGVSRTVVREAISQLKSLGLVTSRQGSGMYVRAQAHFEPLSFDSDHTASRDAVIQITEVRRAIEAEKGEPARMSHRFVKLCAPLNWLPKTDVMVWRKMWSFTVVLRRQRTTPSCSRPWITSRNTCVKAHE